jgi:hypothetical protein
MVVDMSAKKKAREERIQAKQQAIKDQSGLAEAPKEVEPEKGEKEEKAKKVTKKK